MFECKRIVVHQNEYGHEIVRTAVVLQKHGFRRGLFYAPDTEEGLKKAKKLLYREYKEVATV